MKALILIIGLIPQLIFCQSNSQSFMSVRGEATTEVEPDRIDLTIEFTETENIKKDKELKEIEIELTKLLKTFAIDPSKLTIDRFAAKRNSYYKSSSNKIKMSKTFKLQIDDFTLVDSLLFKLFEIGANSVFVTNLHSDRIDEYKNDVIKDALDIARARAELMANHINASIGKVLQIKEHNYNYQATDNYDMLMDKNLVYSIGAYGGTDELIGIKKIKLKYVVDVTYEIVY